MKTFGEWWMGVAVDPDVNLDEFTIGQQALLVGWCKASWHARDAEIEHKAQTIAELTAKLDAVRGLANATSKTCEEHAVNPSECCAPAISGQLLDILDAPTKPKEARNEAE